MYPVYPEGFKYKEEACIKIDGEVINVYFPKDSTFIEIVKDLGYKWGFCWNLKKTSTNGDLKDRAAELGNKLLNGGFPIRVYDEYVKEKAINGTFEPECKRWILVRSSGDYKGRLTIWWKGQNDKLYNIARKLPGSKYSSPSVVVKVNYWQEVMDFAEMYSFKVSDAAARAIEEYKKSLETVEVVAPTKVEVESAKDGLADILNSGDDILDDLKD